MRRIDGHYTQPDNKQVAFDFEIPGSWEELEPGQYATALEIMHYMKADRFVIATSLLALLFQKNFPVLANQNEEGLHALIPLTNFFMEDMPPVKNFFPQLKIRKKVCLSPAEDLSNMGFGEWCFAFQFYTYYRQTKDNIWLDRLIATIYRPIDPEQDPDRVTFKGDRREAFNENLIEKRALAVKDLHDRLKLAVLGWFTAAVIQVMSNRPNVFPKASEEEVSEDPGDQDVRTWLTVFRELLGPKWGTTEQLKVTNAMFVLDAMEEQKIEYDRAMKEAKA